MKLYLFPPKLCLLAVVASTFIPASPAQAQSSSQSTPVGPAGLVQEDYKAEFEKVWQTVVESFWDRRLNGVDWRGIKAEYRTKLSEVKSKTEFTRLINAMLEQLHASHASYMSDDEYEFYMLPAVVARDMDGHRIDHIGITGTVTQDGYRIQAVIDNGPAQKAGIHSGDVILSADGGAFTSAGSFRGKSGQVVKLRVKRVTSDVIDSVEVTPVNQNILRAFLESTAGSARVIEYNKRHFGYVHLWTMANDNFKATLDHIVLDQLHETDGLILDLRDGFGGSPMGYADVFTRPDVIWTTQYRQGPAHSSYTGYGHPMVVLINSGTRSAKEFFSYQLKSSHRATLIGKPTAGAFLGAGSFPISTTGLLELPIVGLRVDGQPLEGRGVQPDIYVESGESYTERDPQMLKAEATLFDQISRQVASHK